MDGGGGLFSRFENLSYSAQSATMAETSDGCRTGSTPDLSTAYSMTCDHVGGGRVIADHEDQCDVLEQIRDRDHGGGGRHRIDTLNLVERPFLGEKPQFKNGKTAF